MDENDTQSPIYLDYAATTPVAPEVAEKMMQYLTREGTFGNPASRSHRFGWRAEEAVDYARQQVADLIQADLREIIFTSGATEANNLAIKGVAQFYAPKGRHIITCKTEHKAVLDTCRYLEREGFQVTYLDPEASGIVPLERILEAIRPDTILVSLMLVNNEIGIIQDISAVTAHCRTARVLVHVDAAQAAGKIPIDVNALDVDLLSLSAHKLYGPKGIGALYVRRQPRVRLTAQMHGGGHERGLRSGTLPVHQVVGFGHACELAKQALPEEAQRISALRNQLWTGLSTLEAIAINGDPARSVPGILNLSFAHVEGESLMMGLDEIAVSSGSACTSSSLEPSYVLRALGRPDELAHSSIRFSLGRYTTAGEIAYVIQRVHSAVAKLRELSPLWEMYQQGVDLKSIAWATH